MDTIAAALATLQPKDLFPTWYLIDRLEQSGQMPTDDALRFKHGIFGLMVLWNLEPDDVLPPVEL